MVLHELSNILNFLALLMAIWLGLYLVMRNPRRPITWLSALALWSMGGFFFNQLLALNPPPIPSDGTLRWLEPLLLFWPRHVFDLGWQGWIQGWLGTPAAFFWFEATLFMLPGRFDWKRWIFAAAGYLVILIAIFIKIFFSQLYIPVGDDLYFIKSVHWGSLVPLSMVTLGLFTCLSVFNLLRASRVSQTALARNQFQLMIAATLIGGATGLLELSANWIIPRIPRLLISFLLLITVLLAGISIARYNALLDRRSMRKDFLYNLAQSGIAVIVYLFFYLTFNQLYPLPKITFVFIGSLAVISHSLVDITRFQLDRLFYYGKSHQLRQSLRQLYKLDRQSDHAEAFDYAIKSLVEAINASWGVLLRFKDRELIPLANYNWTGIPLEQAITLIDTKALYVDDLVVLKPQFLPPPFDRVTLLAPLYDQGQIGVVFMGRSRSPAGYSEAELGSLVYATDYLVDMILRFEVGGVTLDYLDGPPLSVTPGEFDPIPGIPLRQVELALRNLHDYAYLADNPLAKTNMVRQCLEKTPDPPGTHIDRGKVVSGLLVDAVENLRPCQGDPVKPLPRTWYPYIILRDAYLFNESNREIMSRLYISEGTFNRTRRAAIRSVARILGEMNANLG
jgi:hypothetical protein